MATEKETNNDNPALGDDEIIVDSTGDADFDGAWDQFDELDGEEPNEPDAEEPPDSNEGEGGEEPQPTADPPPDPPPDPPKGEAPPKGEGEGEGEQQTLPLEDPPLEDPPKGDDQLAETRKELEAIKAERDELKKNAEKPPDPPKEAEPDPDLSEILGPVKELEPELATAIETLVTGLNKKINTLEGKVQTTTKESALERGRAEVTAVHPKWIEDVKGEPFKKWLSSQKPYVQNTYDTSAKPRDMIDILSDFKASTAPPPAPKPDDGSISKQDAKRELTKGTATKQGGRAPKPKESTAGSYEDAWDKA